MGEKHVIDNDDAFDALGATQRRRLLVALLETDPQRVPELTGPSDALAHGNDGLLEEYLSNSDHVAGIDDHLLRQHCVHLPMLVDYAYVDWDHSTNLVTAGSRFEELRGILGFLATSDDGCQPASIVLDSGAVTD